MNKEGLDDLNLEELLTCVETTPRYVWFWWSIEEFFINWFSPKRWCRRIKFFWQRRTRGFDDSETWDLDDTFLKWFLPRFERFNELNNGYPEDRGSFENWKNEINQRIIQLKAILDGDNNWYTEGYEKEIDDFLNWFKDNIRHLWW